MPVHFIDVFLMKEMMMSDQWPHQSNVDKFYGNPRGNDGEVNRDWVRNNIERISPPWALVTAWDFEPITRGVQMHRKCIGSLQKIFNQIWQAAGQDQKKINEWGMNLYAGGFNYRLMRQSTRLSMHSWGCAIDFDSARNGFGDTTPHFRHIPPVLDAFASEGWVWGGNWLKPDGMHWQAAVV